MATITPGQAYNAPTKGKPSSIGPQIQTYVYARKAIISQGEKKVFTPYGNRDSIPKHYGKEIRKFIHMPLLDDRNINKLGIDPLGLTTTREVSIIIKPFGVNTVTHYLPMRANGTGPDAATALANAKIEAERYFKSVGLWNGDYATTKADLEALDEPWEIIDTLEDVPHYGNVYGSSLDATYISENMPVLGEFGGRFNRVGLTREEVTSTMAKFGFFFQYSKDSYAFDTEADLWTKNYNELVRGANEMQEAQVQIDILNNAGVRSYSGTAISADTLSGDVGNVTELSYSDFTNMHIDLDNNECPMGITRVTGSTKIDTRTVVEGRVTFCSNKLTNSLESIVTPQGKPALIKAVQYADASKTLPNEFGTIGHSHIVFVRKMMEWRGAGAEVTNNAGYYETGGKYDVMPLLTIGADAFSIIDFAGSKSKMGKFEIIHVKPGKESANLSEPFGQEGFISFLWWYGFLPEKPERIALHKTIARY